MPCTKFEDMVSGKSKKLYSVRDLTDLITHCAFCGECHNAYMDWYHSPRNPNYERYMKEIPEYAAEIAKRKANPKPL